MGGPIPGGPAALPHPNSAIGEPARSVDLFARAGWPSRSPPAPSSSLEALNALNRDINQDINQDEVPAVKPILKSNKLLNV